MYIKHGMINHGDDIVRERTRGQRLARLLQLLAVIALAIVVATFLIR